MDPTPLPQNTDDLVRRNALIHREFLQLSALILIAVAGFWLTRRVAADSRAAGAHDAEVWYEQGQQQAAQGRLDLAIDALRKASARNRHDRRYALALARALDRAGDTDAAWSALLMLRDASPEDAEINVELARLAARRQEVGEAVRFYHNALYAPWPSDASDERRRVRFELIELLLGNGHTGRALSELLAVSTDVPHATDRVHVGQLFARAGDSRHALEQYDRVLQIDPDNQDALVGAGTAAFQLGDFARARDYLRGVAGAADDVAHTREVAALVLSIDPLARHIGAAERRRRLVSDLEYVQQRLVSCLPSLDAVTDERVAALRREMEEFRQRLRPSSPLDQDILEAGLDLIERAEGPLGAQCRPSTSWDEALILNGRQHAMEGR